MKRSQSSPHIAHRLVFGLGLAMCGSSLAFVGGCAGEEQEGERAQFPQPPLGSRPGMDNGDPGALPNASTVGDVGSAPGEAPIPIDTVPIPAPPPNAPPPPQEIVAGSTTEEEYDARVSQSGQEYAGQDENQYADADPSALTDFRQALDPYGSWVDDPTYGTVWTPSQSVVGDDFAPYVSGGHWAYDDAQNWVWVSDYDWGWAPFHYGRWAYLGSRWGWIPGREYAGAWVSWRTGYGGYDGYLGWAPLPPTWGWRNGSAFGYGFSARAPYVFCGARDVFAPGVGGHIVTGGQVAVVGSHTRTFAAPTVGGPGGRTPAHPVVGPSPVSVGIGPNQIAHVPLGDRGVMHAQQFARPSTAQAFGAHASIYPHLYAQASPQRNPMASAYNRDAVIARAPQYRGISPAPYRYSSPSRAMYPSHSISIPSYGGYGTSYGAPHYGSSYSAGRYASPGYGGAGPYGGAYGGYHPGGGAVHSSKGK